MSQTTVSRSRHTAEDLRKEILRSGDSRYDHRLHAVLLAVQGFDCTKIAKLFGQDPTTIQRWIKKFNSGGIKALKERKKPGRPQRVPVKIWKQLRNDLNLEPALFGYEQDKWDGQLLKIHLQKRFKIKLGIRQCQRILSLPDKGG